jgi:hypothetical protein
MSGKQLVSLDKPRPLRYITLMPPPTPLPVIAHLIGLFRQGFWRRLAGRLFRGRASQPENDPVEEFLLPILEAIAKIAAAVQDGTYREPEYAPWEPDERDPRPPDEAPKTSGRKPPQIREPEPPWLLEPLAARPRAPRPPPAQPAAEEPSPAPKPSRPPERHRPSWPPARPAARPPRPPPRVRIRSKKARAKPVKKHAHFVTLS